MSVESSGNSAVTRSGDTQVVKIQFEVAGGGDITQGSGAAIAGALKQIFKSIEQQGITQLKLTVDPKSVDTMVEQLHKGLTAKIADMPVAVNLTGNLSKITQMSGTSVAGGNGLTTSIVSASDALAEYNKVADEYNKTLRKLNQAKGRYSSANRTISYLGGKDPADLSTDQQDKLNRALGYWKSADKHAATINKLEAEVNRLREAAEGAYATWQKLLSVATQPGQSTTNTQTVIEQTTQAIEDQTQAIRDNTSAKEENTQTPLGNTTTSGTTTGSDELSPARQKLLSDMSTFQRRYAETLDGTSERAAGLRQRLAELREEINAGNTAVDISRAKFSELKSETSDMEAAAKKAAAAQQQLSGIGVKARMYYDAFASGIQRTPGLAASWDQFFTKLHDGTMEARQARLELNDLIIASKNAGAEVTRLGARIKEAFLHRIGLIAAASTFSTLFRVVREVLSSVKDIDKAMTNLRIITQQSEDAYESFGKTAASVATQIGRSISEVISSAETWARLGYSLGESAELARATGIFANVADVTESEATTSLTSVLKAYDYNANQAIHIVDILTQVGQKYAISASELGTALEKGGAALATAGNTLEESVALMAAGNAAVQNAETVGTALKTTTLRLAGSKAELEEMGEDVDDLASSSSKMREEILKLSGVDIMKDANNYKSTYQILKEIAAVWDKISNVSQMALLEDLAGKRNASVIASVINNLKDLEGAYNDASNSAGTAERAQATYMDSIAGKQAKATAQFQEFSTEILDSGLIKGVYDLGYGFMWLLTQVTKVGQLLPAIVAAIGAISSIGVMKSAGVAAVGILPDIQALVNSGNIDAAAERLSVTTYAIREQTIAQLGLNEAQEKDLRNQIKSNSALTTNAATRAIVKTSLVTQTLAESGLDAAQTKEILTLAGVSEQSKLLSGKKLELIRLNLLEAASAEGVGEAEKGAYIKAAEGISLLQGAKGVKGLAAGFKGLWAVVKAHPFIAIATAAFAAYKFIKSIIKTQDDYVNDAKEALKAAEEITSQLDGIKNEYDELIKRRKELLGLGKSATLEEVNELDVVNERIKALERENETLKAQQKLKGRESYNNLLEAYGGYTYFDIENGRAADVDDTLGGFPLWFNRLFTSKDMADYAALFSERAAAAKKRIEELRQEMTDLNNEFDDALNNELSGHIIGGNMTSYANRPYISASQMWKAGYKDFPWDSVATTYLSESNYLVADETLGEQTWALQVTPILDNGKVLSAPELARYMEDITSEAEGINDLIYRDKQGYGVITAYAKGAYEDTKVWWDALNDKLGEVKDRHAEITNELENLMVVAAGAPNLWGAVYGDIDMSDEDDLKDALDDENEELQKREELISGLEALGYKYNKDATKQAEIEYNNILKETRLRRDMWLIASGDAEGYRRTLEDLAEFEILPIDKIEEFLEKMSDPDWAKTSEGATAIARFAAVLRGFGFEIDNFLGTPSTAKIVQILSSFTAEAEASTSAIEDEINAIKELEGLRDDINALVKAQKEMAESGYLSYETYDKLKGLELDQYVEKVADGYKLANGSLEKYIALSRASLESDVKAAQSKLDLAKAGLASVEALMAVNEAQRGYLALTGNDRVDNLYLSGNYKQILAAVNSATAEVNKAQAALDDFDRNVKTFQRDANGSGSSSSSTDPHLDFWKKVDAEWKHQLEMGQITHETYINRLREVVSATGHLGRMGDKYIDEIRSINEEIRKYDLEQLDKQKDAFESLVDYRIKMLEEETKKQKEELDKRKEALEDFYDKQIEMLEDQFDEEDYLEEQAEKRKKLADMQRQMDMLKRDDSAYAQKKLAELEDEYAKEEKEYRQWETEQARDKLKKALEDERDASIKTIEDAQDALEKTLEDSAALRRRAVEDILNGNEDVMRAMEQFSIEQGEWLDQNITGKWDLAREAVQKYGGALAALKALIGVDAENNETYRFFADIFSGEYKKHAAGTSNASAGWAVTQENGFEAIMRKSGGMFTLLGAGDKVFNASATDFLYAFANNPMDILASSMSRMLSRSSLSPAFAGSSGSNTTNIDMGDVIINGDTNDKTVSEIRREKRALMNELLHEFKKLRGF